MTAVATIGGMHLTAVVWPEDGWFVALCPELDVVSQGRSEDEAAANLREAVELLLECAPADEVAERYRPGRVRALNVA